MDNMSVVNHSGVVSENRPPTPDEKQLLIWLISNGKPEARDYMRQVEELRVISRCSCGCPTVDFTPPKGPSDLLADFYGITPENVEVGVILHARDGRLSEMEIYSVHQQEEPFGLPKIDTLKNYWVPAKL
jgi:hypothetical protein